MSPSGPSCCFSPTLSRYSKFCPLDKQHNVFRRVLTPPGLKSPSLPAVWQGAGEFPLLGTTDLHVPGPPGGAQEGGSGRTCTGPGLCQRGRFMSSLTTGLPTSGTHRWSITGALFHLRLLDGNRHGRLRSSLPLREVGSEVLLHYGPPAYIWKEEMMCLCFFYQNVLVCVKQKRLFIVKCWSFAGFPQK